MLDAPEYPNDDFGRFMQQRQYSKDIARRGFKSLIDRWVITANRVVEKIEATEGFLSDAGTRQVIYEAWSLLLARPDAEELLKRIEAADRIYKVATVPAPECIWGDEVERKRGYNRDINWWYYRTPTRGNSAR